MATTHGHRQGRLRAWMLEGLSDMAKTTPQGRPPSRNRPTRGSPGGA